MQTVTQPWCWRGHNCYFNKWFRTVYYRFINYLWTNVLQFKVYFNCWPPGWCSGHCIAVLTVPPETLGSSPGSVAAGRDREVHGATHNWPSVHCAGRDILVPLRTSDSCGGPGAVHANQSRQVHGVQPVKIYWAVSTVNKWKAQCSGPYNSSIVQYTAYNALYYCIHSQTFSFPPSTTCLLSELAYIGCVASFKTG